MVIINDLVLKKSTPYIIPSEDKYINLAINQNYNVHKDIDNIQINYYPQQNKEYHELIQLISQYTNSSSDNIILTHGSGETLKLILNTFTNIDTKILIPVPNYPGFIHDAELKVNNVNKIYFDGLVDDILVLENDIIYNDIIYLSNPNLPLGYEINQNNLLSLINKYPNKLFLIDEAYIEYSDGLSYTKYINLENIIVIRTFSKAFALAGARLGYLVCHKKLVKYLKIHFCTKTVTNYAISHGLKVMKNLDYYLTIAKQDVQNWNEFYNDCKNYISSNDIIYKISYHYGAYCILYTNYPEYIVNLFKTHGYLIRDKTIDVEKKCVRISLSLKNIMDDLLILIKKINGYYIYDTYYIDIDETIREQNKLEIYPGINDALNLIHKKSNIIMITNNVENYSNIFTYLKNNKVPFDKLISPLKDLNIIPDEYNNGWLVRNNKLYITKYPIISKELYDNITKYKHIYVIEKSFLENGEPFVGQFLQLLEKNNIKFQYTIIGKESLILDNVNKNSIMIGDSIIDYKFAKNNNIFYYNNNEPKDTLEFLNHKAIISLSNDHSRLIDLLNRIIYVFKLLNLSFWAECGTLLGAVRYNKILPWDEDCDLGILKSDEEILTNNIEVFKQHKLRIQRNKSTKAYWQIDTLYNNIGAIDPDLHIDIFLFMEHNNRYMNADYRFQNPDFEIGHCNISYTKDELFPLKTLNFYNTQISVPNKSDEVLQHSLGKNYLHHCIIKKYINETDVKILECNLNNKFNDRFII